MKTKKILIKLITLGVLSISLLTILFLNSENQIHRNNTFIRRYPHHPISKKYDIPLKYNSYYMAGYEKGNLYLGNHTAPLHLLKVNIKTQDTQHIRIHLKNKDLPFRSASVKLYPPYFFITDGTVPCIFRGHIGEWKANFWMKDKAYFTNTIPIDSNTFYIKTISSRTNQSILGTIEKRKGFEVKLDSSLLVKQMDGVFDVDGIMLASEDKKYIGYVYFYRNQFFIMNYKLDVLVKDETIDTVRIAQIKLSKINKDGEVKMAAPPLVINKTATLMDNFLLINSNRLGKYEAKEMLNQASIIDVYNWKKQSYEFSFYVYDVNQNKVKEFKVYDDYLVALIGNSLSIYQLKPSYFKLG